MIEVNQIYNEHCFETMNAMKKNRIAKLDNTLGEFMNESVS